MVIKSVSDFILPGDIERMALQSAGQLADGWAALERLCRVKQYPLDIAIAKVEALIAQGLTQPESLHKVYHEVRLK